MTEPNTGDIPDGGSDRPVNSPKLTPSPSGVDNIFNPPGGLPGQVNVPPDAGPANPDGGSASPADGGIGDDGGGGGTQPVEE